jgi:hypothetical protein
VLLVIVEETYYWRHSHRKGCRSFRTRLARIARYLLLLAATPFQMHRDALLEVLPVGDAMEPTIGSERVFLLRSHRERMQEATAEDDRFRGAACATSRPSASLSNLSSPIAILTPKPDTINES